MVLIFLTIHILMYMVPCDPFMYVSHIFKLTLVAGMCYVFCSKEMRSSYPITLTFIANIKTVIYLVYVAGQATVFSLTQHVSLLHHARITTSKTYGGIKAVAAWNYNANLELEST